MAKSVEEQGDGWERDVTVTGKSERSAHNIARKTEAEKKENETEVGMRETREPFFGIAMSEENAEREKSIAFL